MQEQKTTIQLSAAQIVSGALASVSAAIVASTFGGAGTLIGAAVTSIVATIGGALYTHAIEQAHARARLRRNLATGATTRQAPPAPPPAGGVSWRTVYAVAGAAVAVFALALGALTVIEAVAREPVAALVGHAAPDNARTTVGAVLQRVADEGQTEAEPPPADTPQETPPAVAPGGATAGATPTPTPPARTTPTTLPPTPTKQAAPAPAAPPPLPTRPQLPASPTAQR